MRLPAGQSGWWWPCLWRRNLKCTLVTVMVITIKAQSFSLLKTSNNSPELYLRLFFFMLTPGLIAGKGWLLEKENQCSAQQWGIEALLYQNPCHIRTVTHLPDTQYNHSIYWIKRLFDLICICELTVNLLRLHIKSSIVAVSSWDDLLILNLLTLRVQSSCLI